VGADLFLRDAYTAPRPFPLLALNADGTPNTKTHLQPYDVAGPLCFAGDYLARNAPLPELHEGDWLVVQETGANAYGLWSRHCSRTIPAVLGHRPSTGEVQKLSDRTEINF
jgi:diaminopimelate decarboxylase